MELAGLYGEAPETIPAGTVVLVTMRDADDVLMRDLQAICDAGRMPNLRSLSVIGDAHAPGLLAEAVFTGHAAARALDGPDPRDTPFRIEQADIDTDLPFSKHFK